MTLRIMASRHSAFYSPLIATIARGFKAKYSVLGPGQRSHELIRDGAVDIMQSAPSSNWGLMDRGIGPLPVHFALINRRDGFFLVAREPSAGFAWKDLEGRQVLADHGGQPLAMLQYAVRHNGVDWADIQAIDRGSPAAMMEAFERGEGDYIHLQAPGPQILEEAGVGSTVVSVGASMPEVAFSTLCCGREFFGRPAFTHFVDAYKTTREWVQWADPHEVASIEASFFPGVSAASLAEAVRRYQALGTWTGSAAITQDLYQQALTVFGAGHPFSAVCV